MSRLRNRFHQHDSVELALANFSLTFAKALLVFCVVLFILISPEQGKDGTKPKAEFLITVDWSGEGRYDVDSWMKLPDGSVINFQNRESAIAFLERDDLGNACDATTSGGKSLNACEEIVVLRGVMPGEYVLALHLYSAKSSTVAGPTTPITVHLKVEKLNPNVVIAWQGEVTLDQVRQEKGVTRFSVHPDGRIEEFNADELPALVSR